MYTAFVIGFVASGWFAAEWWIGRRKRLRALRDTKMIEQSRVVQENKLLKQQLGLPPERRIALYSEGEEIGSGDAMSVRTGNSQRASLKKQAAKKEDRPLTCVSLQELKRDYARMKRKCDKRNANAIAVRANGGGL